MTGAVVLAAGAATRMGRLKQLLPYRRGTLLGHAVRQAEEAGFAPLIVVVGAEAATVRSSLSGDGCEIVENAAWETGMGSSIAAGMRRLRERHILPASMAVLLGDQPLVESRHLREMARMLKGREEAAAVAAEYNGMLGVPAIFKSELFTRLENLTPETGARSLLRDSAVRIARFPLPEAGIDLDTPEDFAALTSSERAAAGEAADFHR